MIDEPEFTLIFPGIRIDPLHEFKDILLVMSEGRNCRAYRNNLAQCAFPNLLYEMPEDLISSKEQQ
jgi:hypothetical protein